jgi:hypothetical protein
MMLVFLGSVYIHVRIIRKVEPPRSWKYPKRRLKIFGGQDYMFIRPLIEQYICTIGRACVCVHVVVVVSVFACNVPFVFQKKNKFTFF